MSWISFDLTPDTLSDKEFLSNYQSMMREFVLRITKYRAKRFRNQEKIFEIDLDLLGVSQSQLYFGKLPYSHLRQMVTSNSQVWKNELYRSIYENDTVNSKNVSLEQTISDTLPAILSSSDYEIEDNKLTIYSANGSQFTFSIYMEDSIIGDLPEKSALRLNPVTNTADLRIDFPENTKTIDSTKEYEIDCLFNILSVKYSDRQTAQLNIPAESTVNYISALKKLGMYWKQLSPNTYLIAADMEGVDRITEFVENSDRSIKSYYTLFGFPKSSSRRLKSINAFYDKLSAEEFVIYGYQNRDISSELAKNISYIPYQPHPTISSVRKALLRVQSQFEQIRNSPTKKLCGYNVEEVVQKYKERKKFDQVSPLDILPVEFKPELYFQ